LLLLIENEASTAALNVKMPQNIKQTTQKAVDSR
jgi:hypothetical protein